jgi:hypothetical protein
MVPVVCAWKHPSSFGRGSYGPAWRDAASDREMTHLVTDVPDGEGADWHPLPDWTAKARASLSSGISEQGEM